MDDLCKNIYLLAFKKTIVFIYTFVNEIMYTFLVLFTKTTKDPVNAISGE